MNACARSLCLCLALTGLTALALSNEASAQTPQACLAQQLRASGRICKAFARCHAVAMKSAESVDPACFDGAARRLGMLFAEIEELALGACLTEGADSAVATAAKARVDAIASALTPGGGRCAGKKMGYLGKECSGYLRCYAAGAAASSSVDPACLAKNQENLQKAFDKTERKGDCVVTGDRATLEAVVAALSEEVYVILRGTGSTTTTSSTSTSTLP